MIKPISTFEEYTAAYKQSLEDPEAYWEGQAAAFTWMRTHDKVLEWNFTEPSIKWFPGARLNITENLFERHLPHRANQTAVIWEPNNPADPAEHITYADLFSRVCKFGNALRSQGVKKGDRICIYMPMVPELMVAVLACARIGAIHSVVFAGFSATSLADRIQDADCRLVLCSDGGYRGDKVIKIKDIVDDALALWPGVTRCIVSRRTNTPVKWTEGRDLWWEDALEGMPETCPAEPMEAEDILFILYTSGSTGKPKGVVHTTAGYMVWAEYTFKNVFGYRDGEIYWSTADLGWITGHTYLTYGPLLAGATTLMFEGIPTWPDAGRFWQVIDKHRVNIFYTAPTAIRSLEAYGLEYVTPYSLESLRVLGTVGEPINAEAWHWYKDNIGKGRCALCDTWWQTETGGHMISGLAEITPEKPSFAGLPLPGIHPVLVDAEGNIIEGNEVEGNLCIAFPWPGMLRTTYGDHERCRQTYFSTYPGKYFTGDGAKRDADGYYRILGRVDDVINVSGHRMGTAEVENAINEHPMVIESAVVGYPHDIKGQGIYAFVIVDTHLHEDPSKMRSEINAIVSKMIGPIAKPDKIQSVPGLPKTRSGKIMRRILRKVAEGDISNLGDISTLLDPGVVDAIVKGAV
ncbi:MAG: acetate--CoA ligase [Bacteroidota bacterium]